MAALWAPHRLPVDFPCPPPDGGPMDPDRLSPWSPVWNPWVSSSCLVYCIPKRRCMQIAHSRASGHSFKANTQTTHIQTKRPNSTGHATLLRGSRARARAPTHTDPQPLRPGSYLRLCPPLLTRSPLSWLCNITWSTCCLARVAGLPGLISKSTRSGSGRAGAGTGKRPLWR